VFDVAAQHALSVLGEVTSAIQGWRTVAARNGVNRTEMARFQAAFEWGQKAMAEAMSHTQTTAKGR
jgi:hypothetical protein